jgi:hypothetical protein
VDVRGGKDPPTMYNICVQRLPEDPECQGVIRAQDDSWQLVIDKNGYPRLYVRAAIEATSTTESTTGLIAIETFFQDGLSVPDIMKSTFGGELPAEEMPEALRECDEWKAQTNLPDPR